MAQLVERRERMRALLARFERSGITAASFCRRHGLQPQKLSYWKRVLRQGRGARRTRRSTRTPPAFVPVNLVNAPAETGGLEILLASGERVRVERFTSPELLRAVLTVLRQAC